MRYLLTVLLMVMVLITTGCTNENKNGAVNPIETGNPTVTVTQTQILPVSIVPTLAEKPVQENTDDRNFVDAVGICYNNTPVMMDMKTYLAFTICMQHTPIPTGSCAKMFRSEILEYTTKDDDTTAGYQRSTYNMQVARVRYSECLSRIY
jgi:hypothetical protein